MHGFTINRNINMHTIKIITLLIIFVSCNVENNTPGKIRTYYSIDSVLNQQREILNNLNPRLQKLAWVDQQQDTTSVRLDSAGWAREMQIFNNISINKPALRDSYLIDSTQAEDGIWVSYTAKEALKEELEIEYMHIFFNNNRKLQEVELLYKELGSLYNSKRKMHLGFNQNQLLSNYKIKGYQKIILKDTIRYRINASIIYD